MRRFLRRAIPSMFQRRLLLLLLCACLATLALAGQTFHLTLGPGAAARRRHAESLLSVRELIPTVRGRILDAKGRVLAVDKPAWAIAVDYDVIVGEWAYDRGRDAAIRAAGNKWKALSADQRAQLVDHFRKPFDDQVDRMWIRLTELYRPHHPNFVRSDINHRINAISQRVQQVSSHLWSVWRKQREAELNEPVPLSDVAKPIAEQTQPHVILDDISESTLATVRSLKARAKTDPAFAVWAHIHLKRPEERRYPFTALTVVQDRKNLPSPIRNLKPDQIKLQGIAVHILGQMRDVWKKDIDGPNARPFSRQDPGGYLPGDRRGSFGIEASQESRLRGTRGELIHHLDSETRDVLEPRAGHDVQLTIDIKLQAQVQAIMSPDIGLLVRHAWNGSASKPDQEGEPLTGAAVVMRVKDSAILASVSMPAMSLRTLKLNPQAIYGDTRYKPYLNRVIAAIYPPGSTVKPLLLPAAITAGKFGLGQTLDCEGYLYPNNPNAFRCWIYKEYHSILGSNAKHGIITGDQAIEESCDVFFYKIGRRMGVPLLDKWYSSYGYGQSPDCGLNGAYAGLLPKPSDPHTNDAIFMGIGQGPIAVSPLQVAAAYATLARGGIYMPPTYVADPDRLSPRKKVNLHLNTQAVDESLKGMYLVTHGQKGTGHYLHINHRREEIFNIPGVTVYGKSGTADPGVHWVTKQVGGKTVRVKIHRDDVAWFVTLVKPDHAPKPQYVVLCVVPYAGSGAQVAAPICNQIIHALKSEGYLN